MDKILVVEVFQDFETKYILGLYRNLEKAKYDAEIEMELMFSHDRGRSKYKGKNYKVETNKIVNQNSYQMKIVFEDSLAYDAIIMITEYTVK